MNGHQEWFELEDEKASKRHEIDITKDFTFNPVKLKCRKHPTMEIEFCHSVTSDFYCRMCRETYIDSDDVVLSSIAVDIQQRLSSLKTKYMQTKRTLFEKMKSNQKSVEEFFKMYYDTLDMLRFEYLSEEYSYRGKMVAFEKELRNLVG